MYSQHASSVLSISIMKVSICLCYSVPQHNIYEKQVTFILSVASNISTTFIIIYLLIYLQIYSAIKSASYQPSSS